MLIKLSYGLHSQRIEQLKLNLKPKLIFRHKMKSNKKKVKPPLVEEVARRRAKKLLLQCNSDKELENSLTICYK
jgi:hypothetical protein